jgi:hypothetical protein
MPDGPHRLMFCIVCPRIIAAAILDWVQSPRGIDGAGGEAFFTFSAIFMWLKTRLQETHSFPSTKT